MRKRTCTNNAGDEWVRRIRNGDENAFEELFFEYYGNLCGFAMKIIKSRELTKDCVQEVFLKIWRNREAWEIHYSLKVYLYQAVRNQALNLVEQQKNSRDYSKKYIEEFDALNEPESKTLSDSERVLVDKIWELVEAMPERRRSVFELHRKRGLSYKEISKVLNIKRKTVENHMGKALQFIREQIDSPLF